MKLIEFFNLNADYYQDTTGLEKRDYFQYETSSHRQDISSQNGKVQTDNLGQSAHDLLEMKRKVIDKERQEIKQDLSNVNHDDSFEETVFKIFEQIKAYNNRLTEFNKDQKDLLKDLEQLEK
jgi:hypothetical protein